MHGKNKSKATHVAASRITGWIGSPASIVVHTIIFISSFTGAYAHVISFDRMLLVLTTIVSLEAIYLAIFIQMTINQTTESLEEVEQDIDAIQEDIDEIQEDVEEISEEDKEEGESDKKQEATLAEIQAGLRKLMNDVERLQNKS